MKDGREHLQLFDLIARAWTAPAPVTEAVFNADQTAVAFGCANGAIAIAATADTAGSDARIRRAADTAQLSIQPRNGTYPGLRFADHTEGRSTPVGTYGKDGFLFGKTTGRLNSVTPGGISVHLPPKAAGSISSAVSVSGGIAYAMGNALRLWVPDQADRTEAAPDLISLVQFSADGLTLACGHHGGVMLWRLDGDAPPRNVALNGTPSALIFSGDGRHLACCMDGDGLALIDLASQSAMQRGAFPAPVRSAGFAADADIIAASGAYRVAAWTLGPDARPITTGKPGLMLVDRIATAPNRNLVAVGYANGLVSLAEIGSASEMLLRQNTGAAVTALTWSANGRMLAIGGHDGSAALVDFPETMFKI